MSQNLSRAIDEAVAADFRQFEENPNTGIGPLVTAVSYVASL